MKTFGDRLREERERQGLTQTKLAEIAGIDRSYISWYENGRFEPKLSTLTWIAKALNVSLDYLAGME